MLSGIYAAATGMAAQQAYLEAVSNDIANVNTVGYRAQRIDFRDLAYGEQRGVLVGGGAAATTIGVTQSPGARLPNDSPLALAIDGPGYFQVRRADGSVALTRSGDFRLDAGASIVLASGERLEPPVTMPAGASLSELVVHRNGQVVVAGQEIGRIVLVDVPAPSGLIAVGGGLYAPTEASGAPAATGSTIVQRQLEASNVNLAEAMVGIVEAQRGFQLTARALRTQDQLMEIVNQIRR